MVVARTLTVLLAGAVLTARADWCLHARLRLPGASVSTFEERVVPIVERGIRTVPGVRSVRTVLRPEHLLMVVTLGDSAGERRFVRLDLASRLESLRPDLPAGVENLTVEDVYLRTYPLVVAVSGKGTSMRELKLRARDLLDELLRFPDVADARLVGAEQEEVVLSVPKDRFLLCCSVDDLGAMLTATFELEPSGALDIGSHRVRVRSKASVFTADDILDLPFTIYPQDGKAPMTVMLRDHMKVSLERSRTPPDAMTGVDGERCVLLAVAFDRPPADRRIDELLARAKAEAPLGVEFDVVHDRRAAGSEPTLLFDLRLREGIRIEKMDECSREFARTLKGLPGVRRTLALAGDARFRLEPDQELEPSPPNHALLVLELAPGTDRAALGRRVAELARKASDGLQVWPRDPKLSGFGEPVERTLTATDPKELERLVEKMVEAARVTPGVDSASSDWGEQVESLRFELYESRARQLALTHKDISLACRMAIEGRRISSCWDRGDRLPIVLRIARSDIQGPQDLETMWAYSPALDKYVPFSQVVSGLKSVAEPGCHIRESGRYQARVKAYVRDSAAAKAVLAKWSEVPAKDGCVR